MRFLRRKPIVFGSMAFREKRRSEFDRIRENDPNRPRETKEREEGRRTHSRDRASSICSLSKAVSKCSQRKGSRTGIPMSGSPVCIMSCSCRSRSRRSSLRSRSTFCMIRGSIRRAIIRSCSGIHKEELERTKRPKQHVRTNDISITLQCQFLAISM